MDGGMETDRLLFEAVVAPHRSLSRRGMVAVIGFMFAGSLTVTSLMFLLGAWPVIGFNGADLALACFLMWLNVRAARAREIIQLRETGVRISRTDVQGRAQNFIVPSPWLTIVLEERDGTVPKLLLAVRGARYEVARQLGEAQKRDLAAALSAALHKWRNPRFDQPS
jgi:uncharacterized membrane protein